MAYRALPRTAAGRRPAGQEPAAAQGQLPGAGASAAAAPDSSNTSSPRGIVGALPLQPVRSVKSDRLLARPDGHAQDIVHLLNASWFGPLNGGPAPIVDDDELELPPPPLPRRRAQAPAAGKASGGTQQQHSASPSTTSGGGSQHGSDGSGGPRRLRPTLPQPILTTQQAAARAAQAAAVQDLPGIGTWAGRYRLFGRDQQPEPAQQQRQEQQQQQAEGEAAAQGLPGVASWAGRYCLFGQPQQDKQQQQQEQAPGSAEQQQQQQQQVGSAEAPPTSPGRQPSEGAAAAAEAEFGSFVVLGAGGNFGGGGGGAAAPGAAGAGRRAAESYSSDQAQEEAWRWRFSRKWASEQQKFYDDQPASMASDDLDPLAFTQACGMGVNLQLMPGHATPQSASRGGGALAAEASREAEDGGKPRLETSTSNLSMLETDASYQLSLLGAEMSPGPSTHGARAAALALQRSGSGSMPAAAAGPAAGAAVPPGAAPPLPPPHRRSKTWGAEGGARSPRGPSATRSVLSMANKARDLLQKQGAIEAEVADRWERSRTAGDAWAGRDLAPAAIDTLGRFKYCVLRVSDNVGHTRFVVRGRRGASPAALLQHAVEEAAAAGRAGGVPAASIEVVGEGVMEWREDTERALHLSPSTVPADGLRAARRSGSDSPTKALGRPPAFLGDVSGLAASLLRQALPCHIRITTAADGRSSSASALANRI